jgi:hypothetical protein
MGELHTSQNVYSSKFNIAIQTKIRRHYLLYFTDIDDKFNYVQHDKYCVFDKKK